MIKFLHLTHNVLSETGLLSRDRSKEVIPRERRALHPEKTTGKRRILSPLHASAKRSASSSIERSSGQAKKNQCVCWEASFFLHIRGERAPFFPASYTPLGVLLISLEPCPAPRIGSTLVGRIDARVLSFHSHTIRKGCTGRAWCLVLCQGGNTGVGWGRERESEKNIKPAYIPSRPHSRIAAVAEETSDNCVVVVESLPSFFVLPPLQCVAFSGANKQVWKQVPRKV